MICSDVGMKGREDEAERADGWMKGRTDGQTDERTD